MLQEIKDLQQHAIDELCVKISGDNKEYTFRAPTGSGKTRMMSDFMNRILTEHSDVVFLVSTLSKGNLAKQNYDVFNDCAIRGVFPAIKPYLINTEISGEESLFIPSNYNVYVLPRDLFKKNGRLMQGAMMNFLREMTEQVIDKGLNKKIYLIKDESHQATNNLDDISSNFFTKIINFSATPNMKRGQMPDVQITDEEAVQAKLIKRVELYSDDSIDVNDAIEKFVEIKGAYRNLLNVNPCLIIQISNKNKAEEEWTSRIKPALDKYQELKWMKIMDKDKDSDTNDNVKKRLPVSRWKDYAKGNKSTIDVIIFKMVISEGWDIPRACMLYQVRDTKSKQLDEQVVGRVRRNPRLLDFEILSDEAKELATTAWVWGLAPKSMKRTYRVCLWTHQNNDIQDKIRIKTTRLANLASRKNFDVDKIISPNKNNAPIDIFSLYNKLQKCENSIQDICYKYAGSSVSRWWNFMEQIDKVKKEYNTIICDYSNSMEIDKETSFPAISSYVDNENRLNINDWIWCKDNLKNTLFSFDSEAECQWAALLQKLSKKYDAIANMYGPDEEHFLWGKNFPQNSDIRYEYYSNGIHSSYPDFIMKDKKGIIHVFEVKSVNVSSQTHLDKHEYDDKIRKLRECYKACSKLLTNHRFYLPIMKDDDWNIRRYVNGNEDVISEDRFVKSLL